MAKKHGQIAQGGIRVDGMNNEFLKELIYNKSKEEVLEELDKIEVAEILHIYMNNYNWDDGFEIPKKVLSKACCELSTALLVFYLADGERYLEDKDEIQNNNLTEWSIFLQDLYNQIMSGKFKKGEIFFEPPLSKVQLYKIKKILGEDEDIFIKKIGEKKFNIIV